MLGKTAQDFDKLFSECLQFRSKNRIPALSYYYQGNHCSLWRCAQPKSGLLNKTSNGDVEVLLAIAKMSKAGNETGITIFDARPYNSALGNRARGGGFEQIEYYQIANAKQEFLNIRNIHAVRKSFQNFEDLCIISGLFKNYP